MPRPFNAADATPIEVWYEDLAADYQGVARRVVAELGIGVPEGLVLGPGVMTQQADQLTEEWVQRFGEAMASPSVDALSGARRRQP